MIVGTPKFDVTVSRKVPAAGVDLNAESAEMKEVDEAIVLAFKQNWAQPSTLDTNKLPINAEIDVAISRDGRVMSYMLAKPSGYSQMDMSALRTCGLVKRIATPLPSQFSGDSYEVQIHFRVE